MITIAARVRISDTFKAVVFRVVNMISHLNKLAMGKQLFFAAIILTGLARLFIKIRFELQRKHCDHRKKPDVGYPGNGS